VSNPNILCDGLCQTVGLSHITQVNCAKLLYAVRATGIGRKEARVRSECAAFAMKLAIPHSIPRANAHQKMSA
jgi:hypothetical protein